MKGLRPFHLAIPVNDIAESMEFYGGKLGCPEGRSSDGVWVDYDFFGNQLVIHRCDGPITCDAGSTAVDGDSVPVPHLGAVLEWGQWESLAQKMTEQEAKFVIAPRIRFAGKAGEQAIFFVRDPTGHALEFKAFRDESYLFMTE